MLRTALVAFLSLSLAACAAQGSLEVENELPATPTLPARPTKRTSPLLPKWSTRTQVSPATANQLKQGLTPDQIRTRNIGAYRITESPVGPVRAVAQFEPASAMVVAWLHQQDPTLDPVYVQMIRAVAGKTKVIVVHENGTRETLEEMLRQADIPEATISDPAWFEFDEQEVDSIWIRDYGPDFVADADGNIAMADVRYYDERPIDDAYPTHLSTKLGMQLFRPSLYLEGGNITSNGKGLCLLTTWNLAQNAPEPEASVREMLKTYLGCEKVVFLRRMLREGTGHVDMGIKFVAEDTVLVGDFADGMECQNQAVLRSNYGVLSNTTTVDGKPLKLFKVPMPGNADGNFRTYVNSLQVNNVVLVPVYDDDRTYEQAALKVYREALPGSTIVPVDSTELIALGGAVHCITKTVPAGRVLPLKPVAAKCGDKFTCPTVSRCGAVPAGGSCLDGYLVTCDSRYGAWADPCDMDCAWTDGEEPCETRCSEINGIASCGRKLACVIGCKDECVPGPAQCLDGESFTACGPIEADGCRKQQTVYCEDGESCVDGGCTALPENGGGGDGKDAKTSSCGGCGGGFEPLVPLAIPALLAFFARRRRR